MADQSSNPTCSIIIPVFNNRADTETCLQALFAHPSQASMEVIVVDDASTDDTIDLIVSYGARVTGMSHPENLGFARTCNDGAAIARGQYLVFLNNDTVPQPGWLDALVNAAQRAPHPGIVGAKLLFPDGTLQHAGVVFSSDKLPYHVYAGEPGDFAPANQSRPYQAVTGACLLIEADLFRQLNGFDPIYLNCLEDIDLCLRVGQLGRQVIYCAESRLVHHESKTRGKDAALWDQNIVHFNARWNQTARMDDVQFYRRDKTEHLNPRQRPGSPNRRTPQTRPSARTAPAPERQGPQRRGTESNLSRGFGELASTPALAQEPGSHSMSQWPAFNMRPPQPPVAPIPVPEPPPAAVASEPQISPPPPPTPAKRPP